jgi:hypothetical protein
VWIVPILFQGSPEMASELYFVFDNENAHTLKYTFSRQTGKRSRRLAPPQKVTAL